MCGIVYKSNFYSPTDYNKFILACDKLNHRGPDSFGYLFTKNHSFGHKRLSIIDIENGNQPMSILNHHLIYNGELYNQDELIELLNKNNIRLENHSDTLLLLKLLMSYGANSLKKLNGIFSFVYEADNKVIAARDMFGVKPLYYTIIDNDLFIASEIKAILEYTNEAVINKEGLCELFGMGPSHSQGKTVFKNIYELKPGHMLIFDKENGLKIHKYYEIPVYKNNMSYKEAVAKTEEVLSKAIKRQMVSDVGVSSFLSGGLDSSIISTVVARNSNNLDTYNIDYQDSNEFKPNDFEISKDLDFAKIISDDIDSNLHCVIVDNKSLVENLKTAVDLRDTPGMTDIDSSLYYLAKNIAKKHKVSMSGECADELFGGYSWFYKKNKEMKIFPWIRNIELKNKLLNNKWREKLNLEEYIKNEYDMALAEAPILLDESETDKKHRIMTYLNIKYFMTNLLDRKDRMTMGASLEVRVPFCDKEVVELLYNMPYKYKYRYKTEKKLLRDAYKDIVDKSVIKRKKSPYPKSNSSEYNRRVKELLIECLNDKNSILYELLDIDYLNNLISSDDELEAPWYGQLMRKTALFAYLYQIDYWFKKYNIRIEE
ncbi:MAG: asparagine synthase (glutamine-hydrolyzing) [Acholeplasmatales bacterium]|nr:asparagine synthase (glutamine-hydrolyzing) [Acholeplasmatales bacterium]